MNLPLQCTLLSKQYLDPSIFNNIIKAANLPIEDDITNYNTKHLKHGSLSLRQVMGLKDYRWGEEHDLKEFGEKFNVCVFEYQIMPERKTYNIYGNLQPIYSTFENILVIYNQTPIIKKEKEYNHSSGTHFKALVPYDEYNCTHKINKHFFKSNLLVKNVVNNLKTYDMIYDITYNAFSPPIEHIEESNKQFEKNERYFYDTYIAAIK